jgi:glyoxylase-like metal-dependent hydrolase (beta-lactamase superfamily II)
MEIVTGINQIDGIQGNCFLVERDGLVLIDTGLPRSGKKILAYITGTLRRELHDVHTIIITHYHVDHTGNVAKLRRATGAKVAIHADDADYLTGKTPAAPLKGIRGRVLNLLMFLWPCEPLVPDILLHDGDTLAGLRCIHVPGHTPGSIALLDPERRVLFCGDALLTKNGIVGGPPSGATDNMERAMESIKVIAGLDFDVLLSGHGVPLRPKASDKVAGFLKAQS